MGAGASIPTVSSDPRAEFRKLSVVSAANSSSSQSANAKLKWSKVNAATRLLAPAGKRHRPSTWTDSSFTLPSSTMAPEPIHPTNNPGIHQWVRPYSFTLNPEMFPVGTDAGDILTTAVASGNKVLLPAVTALLSIWGPTPETNPYLHRIFHSVWDEPYPLSGSISLNLYSSLAGKWQSVVVDDQMPVNDRGIPLVLVTQSGSAVWSMFLEKALAKLFGSWEGLYRASPEDILTALTGGWAVDQAPENTPSTSSMVLAVVRPEDANDRVLISDAREGSPAVTPEQSLSTFCVPPIDWHSCWYSPAQSTWELSSTWRDNPQLLARVSSVPQDEHGPRDPSLVIRVQFQNSNKEDLETAMESLFMSLVWMPDEENDQGAEPLRPLLNVHSSELIPSTRVPSAKEILFSVPSIPSGKYMLVPHLKVENLESVVKWSGSMRIMLWSPAALSLAPVLDTASWESCRVQSEWRRNAQILHAPQWELQLKPSPGSTEGGRAHVLMELRVESLFNPNRLPMFNDLNTTKSHGLDGSSGNYEADEARLALGDSPIQLDIVAVPLSKQADLVKLRQFKLPDPAARSSSSSLYRGAVFIEALLDPSAKVRYVLIASRVVPNEVNACPWIPETDDEIQAICNGSRQTGPSIPLELQVYASVPLSVQPLPYWSIQKAPVSHWVPPEEIPGHEHCTWRDPAVNVQFELGIPAGVPGIIEVTRDHSADEYQTNELSLVIARGLHNPVAGADPAPGTGVKIFRSFSVLDPQVVAVSPSGYFEWTAVVQVPSDPVPRPHGMMPLVAFAASDVPGSFHLSLFCPAEAQVAPVVDPFPYQVFARTSWNEEAMVGSEFGAPQFAMSLTKPTSMYFTLEGSGTSEAVIVITRTSSLPMLDTTSRVIEKIPSEAVVRRVEWLKETTRGCRPFKLQPLGGLSRMAASEPNRASLTQMEMTRLASTVAVAPLGRTWDNEGLEVTSNTWSEEDGASDLAVGDGNGEGENDDDEEESVEFGDSNLDWVRDSEYTVFVLGGKGSFRLQISADQEVLLGAKPSWVPQRASANPPRPRGHIMVGEQGKKAGRNLKYPGGPLVRSNSWAAKNRQAGVGRKKSGHGTPAMVPVLLPGPVFRGV